MRSLPSGRSKSSYTIEQVVEGRALAREHLAHGEAGLVHVRHRLDEDEVEAVVATAHRRRSVTRLGMAGQTGALGDPVEHHPANVVARFFVLLAGVAQADDDLHSLPDTQIRPTETSTGFREC